MQALSSAANNLESAFDEYSDACVSLATLVGQSPIPNSLQRLHNGLDEGLRMLSAIEERVKLLKATLARPRNSISVPINFLPDEVLAHVFYLVTSAQSACFKRLVDNEKLPVDVLATSQVCSRWRQIALSLPTLWNHINLSSRYRTEYISLGKIFLARSGNLPLSIRVVEKCDMTKSWRKGRLEDFFDEVGPRLESIESAPVSSMLVLLKKALVRCTPGQLTRLTLSDQNVYADGEDVDPSEYCFIAHDKFSSPPLHDHNLRRPPTLIKLDIAQNTLENLLLHIKVLRLDCVYPCWTSKAYHGLVELRLIGPPQLTGIITEHSFASILVSSPKLRVLHFGLEFISTGARCDPVRLEELEEFQL